MTLQTLNDRIREHYSDKKIVFGCGNSDGPKLMLIGEAPGEQEELKGIPFVGKAGKNLDELLALSGLDRGALYISNTVKFRPTRISKAGGTVNRTPTRKEIEEGSAFLIEEIELVKPEVIATLGNTPLTALMGKDMTIGSCHGVLTECLGRKLMPLYHPAALIYNRSLRDTYEQDVIRLGKIIRGEIG